MIFSRTRASSLGSHCSFPHIPGRSLEWRSSCFSRAGNYRTFFFSLPGQLCSLVFPLHRKEMAHRKRWHHRFRWWELLGSTWFSAAATWREGMWNRILLSLLEDSSRIAILSPATQPHLNPLYYIIYNHPKLGRDNLVPLHRRIMAAKQWTRIWRQNWDWNPGDPEVKSSVLLSFCISVVDRSLRTVAA